MMLRLTLGRPDDAIPWSGRSATPWRTRRPADIAEPGRAPVTTAAMGDAVLASLDRLAG